jgi:hypothetical protein
VTIAPGTPADRTQVLLGEIIRDSAPSSLSLYVYDSGSNAKEQKGNWIAAASYTYRHPSAHEPTHRAVAPDRVGNHTGPDSGTSVHVVTDRRHDSPIKAQV